MKLLGWTITRNKALQPVDNRGGWFSLIRESFAGAFCIVRSMSELRLN